MGLPECHLSWQDTIGPHIWVHHNLNLGLRKRKWRTPCSLGNNMITVWGPGGYHREQILYPSILHGWSMIMVTWKGLSLSWFRNHLTGLQMVLPKINIATPCHKSSVIIAWIQALDQTLLQQSKPTERKFTFRKNPLGCQIVIFSPPCMRYI